MSALTFAVAYPDGLGISPNERVHWGERSRRNRNVREVTCAHARRAQQKQSYEASEHSTVQLTVVWPKGARRRDPDNLTPMLKSVIDGLRDAKLILSDTPDHLTLQPVRQHRDATAYWVVVVVQIEKSDVL